MIRSGELLCDLDNAVLPCDVETVLRRIGATHMFWQTWSRDTVYTWDKTPPGFFSLYYGLDSDRFCAVANALRGGWISFTFAQARVELGTTAESRDAQTIWNNFDMPDGLCVQQGFGNRRSVLMVATKAGEAHRLLHDHQMVLTASAARLDMLLRENLADLYKIPRRRGLLSPAEAAVVRAQIDYPFMTLKEQAAHLKISPRTLQKRHADIARKMGVSTFPGAIVVAIERGQSTDQDVAPVIDDPSQRDWKGMAAGD